tara:strand:- start:605 stop:1189 length:585 start_codon:yes stop_codon:yes gene_type:complete
MEYSQLKKTRYFSILENERIIYLFGNHTGKIHTTFASITDNNDSELLTLTNFRIIYESFIEEQDSTIIFKTSDITNTELTFPKKTLTDLWCGIIIGVVSLAWVWISFAFELTSMISWLVFGATAAFSGINLFSYFGTKNVAKLTINTNSKEITFDLLTHTSMQESEEIVSFIHSQILGLSYPLAIDNRKQGHLR